MSAVYFDCFDLSKQGKCAAWVDPSPLFISLKTLAFSLVKERPYVSIKTNYHWNKKKKKFNLSIQY